jgi:hypothetical protein
LFSIRTLSLVEIDKVSTTNLYNFHINYKQCYAELNLIIVV